MRTHILAFVAQNFLNSKKATAACSGKELLQLPVQSQSHINSMIEDIVLKNFWNGSSSRTSAEALHGNEDG